MTCYRPSYARGREQHPSIPDPIHRIVSAGFGSTPRSGNPEMDDIFLVFYLLPASSFSTWLGPTRRIREREKKDLSRCLIQGQPARYVLSFSTVKTLISSFLTPSFASRRAYSLSKIAERVNFLCFLWRICWWIS